MVGCYSRRELARGIQQRMVEALSSKITAWEKEKGVEFLYDGASLLSTLSRLLSMLEEYITLRREKEKEKHRQRDQKRLLGQLMAENETLFGSKPSPSKSGKRASRCSNVVPSIRKFSVGGAILLDPKPERSALVLKCKNKKGSLPIHNSSILGKKNAAGHATQSSGKETSKVVVGHHSTKKLPHSAENETGSQSPLIMMMRKPLSPVSNIADLQKNTTPPSKPITTYAYDRTPKHMGIQVATTPLTSLSLMKLTAMTPDTPCVYSSTPTSSTIAVVSDLINLDPLWYFRGTALREKVLGLN